MASYLLLYALTLLTGFIHAGIGLASWGQPLSLLLLLNGLGYIGLVALHIITEYRGYGHDLHHIILFAYVFVTIIAYFLSFPLAEALTNPIGIATKVDELAILFMLVRYLRK